MSFQRLNMTTGFNPPVVACLSLALLIINGSSGVADDDPSVWVDELEISGHPAGGYNGIYWKTAQRVNGLPVYVMENMSQPGDSAYSENYIYCHELVNGSGRRTWSLQPLPPDPGHWLANAYGEGPAPWDSDWGSSRVTVRALSNETSRKRSAERYESAVAEPELLYGKGKKHAIGYLFRIPLGRDHAAEWAPSEQPQECRNNDPDFRFGMRQMRQWLQRRPGTDLVVNSSFFAPQSGNYFDGNCAKIYGIAVSNFTRLDTDMFEKGNRLDAMFVENLPGGVRQVRMISSRAVERAYNNSTVSTAVGGYLILQDGHVKTIDEVPGMREHAGGTDPQKDKAARTAIAVRRSEPSTLCLFVIPHVLAGDESEYPPWQSDSKVTVGPSPGLLMSELATLMKDKGMTDGLMLDGGGSTHVRWVSGETATGARILKIPQLPKDYTKRTTTEKFKYKRRVYRPIPNILGFRSYNDAQ